MKKTLLTAMGMMVLTSGSVWAQVGAVGPYVRPYQNPRPTVSPYARLRGGGPISYFTQIRPLIQNNRDIQQLQQGVATLGAELQQQGMMGVPQDQIILPTTGHPVRFFDYSAFFSRVGPAMGSPIRGGNYGGNMGGNYGGGYTTPYAPIGSTGLVR